MSEFDPDTLVLQRQLERILLERVAPLGGQGYVALVAIVLGDRIVIQSSCRHHREPGVSADLLNTATRRVARMACDMARATTDPAAFLALVRARLAEPPPDGISVTREINL